MPRHSALVLFVVGTRPEAIKLAPVIRACQADGTTRCCVVVTAQHGELASRALHECHVVEDVRLRDVDCGSLGSAVGSIVTELTALLRAINPSVVVVQGDTSSAVAGALAARYHSVKVAHVEAGLRTHDRCEPFPEETNRELIARLADVHFAPTVSNRANLLCEGIAAERIFVTGNPGIDALEWAFERLRERPHELREHSALLKAHTNLVLVTLHRRENIGHRMTSILTGLLEALSQYRELHIVLPLHSNPVVREAVTRQVASVPHVTLVPALSYVSFVDLLLNASLVVTDSGGVQEEVAHFDKYALITRAVTERPEALCAGRRELAGVDAAQVYAAAIPLVGAALSERAMLLRSLERPRHQVFGDGRAAPRIRDLLIDERSEVPAITPELTRQSHCASTIPSLYGITRGHVQSTGSSNAGRESR